MLILGQHLTSRTEAVRDYLINKVDNLYVAGVTSYSLNKKENYAFFYERGNLKRHCVFHHKILKYIKKRELLIPLTFLFYIIDLVRSLLIFRRKFDYFIGISHFSGFLGFFLKFFGISKKFIYYTIDYYVPYTETGNPNPFAGYGWFERMLLKISIYLDKLAVASADELWDISNRIEEGRLRFGKFNKETYDAKKRIAPLGYDSSFYRNKDVRELDRYTIVFAGVILESQGLELILNVIPELCKLMPEIKVKIIGTGPFLPKFKEMVALHRLERYFKYYGFIDNVEEMLDIIASSAVGVSIWDDRKNKILNAYYGDPGKTKLYSVCGLPVVVSDITGYSRVISQNKAGIAVKYKEEELLNALKTILLNSNDYAGYKKRAVTAGRQYCNSEQIFDEVLN